MEPGFTDEHPPIPGFDSIEMIGRNGGLVYKARHVSSSEPAILRVAPEQPYQQFLRNDAAVLASLDHPNILRLVVAGEVGACFYVATEWVERTLADRMREGCLEIPVAVRLIQALAVALEHARHRGMSHGPLTPDSILLEDESTPKLSAFRAAQPGPCSDPEPLSAPSAFLAPEDLQGSPSSSPEADVYRLGAVMYLALTGHPPFECKTPLELMRAVVEKPPVDPRRLNRKLPQRLEKVCMKCLEKQPHRRFRSVQDLASALEPFAATD